MLSQIFPLDGTGILIGLGLMLPVFFAAGLVCGRTILARKDLPSVQERMRSEERLEKAELVAGFGNWEIHLDDGLVYASEGAKRLYGHEESVLPLEDILEVPLFEYRVMLDEAMRRLIGKNEPYDVEYKIRRVNDNEIRDIRSLAEYDADRNVVFGVIQDITERKDSEKALQESEAKYRTVIERANDGIVILKDGLIIFGNQRMADMLGYRMDEWVGTTIDQYMDQVHFKEIVERHIKKMKGDLVSPVFETELIHKDGRCIPIEFNSGIISHDGKQVSLVIVRDIKARKLAEEALHRSEERYRSILESMEEAYYEVDLSGSFTFFNSAVVKKLGYTNEEMIGLNYKDFNDEENAKKLFQTYHRVYLTGDPVRGVDWEFITKDGKKMYVEASVQLNKDSAGKPIGFKGVVRDISERKLAEEALRRNEERYRDILESMEEAYYEVDLNGDFTFFNASLVRNLGYSPEELMGMNFREYTEPEITNKLIDIFSNVLLSGKTVRSFDWEIITSDGRKIIVESSVSLVRDAHGKPSGFRGVTRNITEKKLAEEALRRSEERYRGILQNMEELYYELDLAGNMMFFNPTMIKETGYTDEELFGMNYRQYVCEEDQAKARDVYKQVFLTGETIKGFDWRIKDKDGATIFMESSVSLMKDAEGRPTGFRGVSRDVTWRRQAEEELRRSEEKYRTIFENTGTATLLCAEDTTILIANSNLEKIFGYTVEEMEGSMSWTAFIDPEDLAGVMTCHERCMQQQGSVPVSFEARCRNRSAELRYMLMSVAMMPGSRQSVISCLDLTDRKRAEEEMRKREKLQGVLEMAGAVCHELNQPLQVLISAADLLAEEKAGGMDHELIGSIQAGVEEIGTLTNKIMKITEYEVKDYLGGKSKIIDIDKSVSTDESSS